MVQRKISHRVITSLCRLWVSTEVGRIVRHVGFGLISGRKQISREVRFVPKTTNQFPHYCKVLSPAAVHHGYLSNTEGRKLLKSIPAEQIV
jgi:hypothetical protein